MLCGHADCNVTENPVYYTYQYHTLKAMACRETLPHELISWEQLLLNIASYSSEPCIRVLLWSIHCHDNLSVAGCNDSLLEAVWSQGRKGSPLLHAPKSWKLWDVKWGSPFSYSYFPIYLCVQNAFLLMGLCNMVEVILSTVCGKCVRHGEDTRGVDEWFSEIRWIESAGPHSLLTNEATLIHSHRLLLIWPQLRELMLPLNKWTQLWLVNCSKMFLWVYPKACVFMWINILS